MTDCKLRGLSPKTLKDYNRHCQQLLILSPQFPPNPELVQRFLASRKGGPYNADSYYRTFRALSRYANRRYKTRNFMKSVTRPRIHREIMPTISNTELDLLSIYLKDVSLRDKAIMFLFIDTAIRSGEAQNLKRKDILEDRIILRGKTGYRIAPISEVIRDLVLSLPVHEDGYVFHGTGKYKNHRLAETGFYKVVKKYLSKVGYNMGKQFGPQILRRSFGRFWLKNGGDMKSLSLILGHKSIKTTDEYYTPLLNGDIVELHQKHSPGKAFSRVGIKDSEIEG